MQLINNLPFQVSVHVILNLLQVTRNLVSNLTAKTLTNVLKTRRDVNTNVSTHLDHTIALAGQYSTTLIVIEYNK